MSNVRGRDNPSFHMELEPRIEDLEPRIRKQNKRKNPHLKNLDEFDPSETPYSRKKNPSKNSYDLPVVESNGIAGGSDSGEDDSDYEEEIPESLLSFLAPLVQKSSALNDLFYSEENNFQKLIDKLVPYIVLSIFIAFLVAVIIINSVIEETEYWCMGDGLLYVMTAVVGFFAIYFKVVKHFFGKYLYKNCMQPTNEFFSRLFSKWYIKYGFFAILLAGVATFLIIDSKDERRRLVSVFGLFLILAFAYVFSHAPHKVKWRHVFWGISFQFILGLLVLRWPLGNSILQCFADKVAAFLAFSNEGSNFVFGELSQPMGIFAFSVLPVTIFFSFCTSILYYYGIVQWIVIKMGWMMQVTIGTTLCESMNAAASIFLGMTESPLLIKPYLGKMTNSELHAIMTAGFATIAGSLLAAYISLGVDPALMITACVMNAPAALAISKLFYPETRKTRISAKAVAAVKSEEINALHAGCVGVSNALPLVSNIAGNLIAFIAFIAFFNSIFDWGCQLVDFEEGTCSLEGVFGYIFMPLAWAMGVEWSDCNYVGQLIGLKVIVNEFVAYTKLSEFMQQGLLSPRSQSIATFAICGFSNISSMGIMMGGLGPMAPNRRDDMAKLVLRAMMAGSMATFSSACIAGTLLSESTYMHYSNTTTTLSPNIITTTLSSLF